MIFFDVTRAAAAGHKSGLTRVSSRLRAELGAAAVPVSWPDWSSGIERAPPGVVAPPRSNDGKLENARCNEGKVDSAAPGRSDWMLTAELFSEAERPGIRAWLARRPVRCAAIFYDAIPLRHPHITWPKSVIRHPDYLKLLATFDHIFAISAASRDELITYWKWLNLDVTPPVTVLDLGADAGGTPRIEGGTAGSPSRLFGSEESKTQSFPNQRLGSQPLHLGNNLLCLGILEPRKNQSFLLDVCAGLWSEGLKFDLDLVGRVNPHFGGPVLKKVREFSKKFSGLHYHDAADDAAVARLFSRARATVLPTIAEGGALPLLESLWNGVPCVCSDLPALRESAAPGGCLIAPANDAPAWSSALRSILTDDNLHARLAQEAATRPLPTWSAAAAAIKRALEQ